jgi:hypothetical protein
VLRVTVVVKALVVVKVVVCQVWPPAVGVQVAAKVVVVVVEWVVVMVVVPLRPARLQARGLGCVCLSLQVDESFETSAGARVPPSRPFVVPVAMLCVC